MSAARKTLREQSDQLFAQVLARLQREEKWLFILKLAGPLLGGALLGIAGFLNSAPDGSFPWKPALGTLGALLLVTGTVIVALAERGGFEEIKAARSAQAAAEMFLMEREQLEEQMLAFTRLDSRRRRLLEAVQVMQEAVERMSHGTDIRTVIEAMLDAGTNDLEGAIGFDAGERWSFAIFRREPASDSTTEVMRRIAVRSAERSRERGTASPGAHRANRKEWRKKEGFTGVCWQRDDDVIEPDLRLVSDEYPVPPEKHDAEDATRYVSVAVIPIRVGSEDVMWGTATATSDRVGRWRRAPTDPREQNVMAVRMLAELIATQVALRGEVNAEGFTTR